MLFKAIELQIHFDARHILAESIAKCAILSQPQAVGINHQVLNGSGLNQIHHGKKVWMQRRFATAELHYLGFTFVGHDSIQHLLNDSETAMATRLASTFSFIYTRIGITNWTG